MMWYFGFPPEPQEHVELTAAQRKLVKRVLWFVLCVEVAVLVFISVADNVASH